MKALGVPDDCYTPLADHTVAGWVVGMLAAAGTLPERLAGRKLLAREVVARSGKLGGTQSQTPETNNPH